MHTPIDKTSPLQIHCIAFRGIPAGGNRPCMREKTSLAPDIEEGLVEKIIAAEGYFDGPYILYEGDQATVVRVTATTEGALLTQETVTAEELKAGPIDVIPDRERRRRPKAEAIPGKAFRLRGHGSMGL
jgi:hypothetical protein